MLRWVQFLRSLSIKTNINEENKRAFERKTAEKFIDIKFGDQIPKWDIVYSQSNGEPDFWISCGDQKIGVEIKRLFVDTKGSNSAKKREKCAWGLCKEIMDENPILDPRGVRIDFSNPVVRKKDRKELITNLVEIIDKYQTSSVKTVEFWPEKYVARIEKEIAFEVNPFLSKYINDIEFCWTVINLVVPNGETTFGPIRDITNSDIQNLIQDSPSKIKGSEYDEIWLLVTWEDSGPSCWYNCDDPPRGPFQSTFDQIYILDRIKDIVHELYSVVTR